MIHFSCNSCHEKLRAKAAFSGRQLRCPKCGQAAKVPRPTVRITCPACGKASRFSAADADKKGRCPACKAVFPIRVNLAQPAAPAGQSSSRPGVSPSPPCPTPAAPVRSAEEIELVAKLDALEAELQKKQAERDRRWFERMQRLRQGGTPAGVDFLAGGMIDHADLKSDVEEIEETVRALEQLGTADALRRVEAYRARKKG